MFDLKLTAHLGSSTELGGSTGLTVIDGDASVWAPPRYEGNRIYATR
jgi:hypothetical protein